MVCDAKCRILHPETRHFRVLNTAFHITKGALSASKTSVNDLFNISFDKKEERFCIDTLLSFKPDNVSYCHRKCTSKDVRQPL